MREASGFGWGVITGNIDFAIVYPETHTDVRFVVEDGHVLKNVRESLRGATGHVAHTAHLPCGVWGSGFALGSRITRGREAHPPCGVWGSGFALGSRQTRGREAHPPCGIVNLGSEGD
jgi:hypothetical protein